MMRLIANELTVFCIWCIFRLNPRSDPKLAAALRKVAEVFEP